MQSQNDALYNYAHSIIRATPKREQSRLSKNAEPDVDDSLALLLSWGAEEKSDSTSSVAADDKSLPEDNSPEPNGILNEGVDKTWKNPRLGSVAVVLLAIIVLVVVLLFWYGFFPIPARTI